MIKQDKSVIMITGGGGYLGSKVAERASRFKHDIFLIDLQFNELSLSLASNRKNVHLITADITVSKIISTLALDVNPDYIFHFGALINRDRDFDLYSKLYKVNVEGTLNLVKALSKTNYKRLIYSSTGEVYGNSEDVPFKECQIPVPASPYSLTKLMGEEVLKTHSSLTQKSFTILRIFNFFGEDMPENFFLNQLYGAIKRDEPFRMTGGEQVRDFLHIDDLVRMILTLAESEFAVNKTINLCSGTGVKLKDIALKIVKDYNKQDLLRIGEIPYRKNEIWNMVGSNELLKSILPLPVEFKLFHED